LALLLAGLSVIAAVAVFVLRRRARKIDPVVAAWTKFCRRLERSGTVRGPTDGPLVLIDRAVKNHPQAEAQLRQIGQVYIELRYSQLAMGEAEVKLKQLRDYVRRLSLPASDKSSSSFVARS
jgi:hypothetical protein